MKLIIQGGSVLYNNSEENMLGKLLDEIGKGMKEKINNTGELSAQIEEAYISYAEFNFQFKIKGSNDLQEITVNHHGEPELLTVIVDVDKDGKIVTLEDNEEESLYSDTLVKIMKGNLQKEFKEIESILSIDDLVQHDEITCRDFLIKFYDDPINESTVWVQFFQESEFDGEFKLIQEVKYTLKDDETLEDVVHKYRTAFE